MYLSDNELFRIIQFFGFERDIVNIMSCSKKLKIMVMEHLLMGPHNSEQFVKHFISYKTLNCKMTLELLNLIIDTLKNENELLHLDRINLTNFGGRLTWPMIDRICELILKFNVKEVMCWRMRESVYWIEVIVPTKLKLVERFTILERDLMRFTPSLKYFTKTNMLQGITELNGLTLQKKEDVERFCQNQLLSESLKRLTVYLPQSISIFDFAFRKIMKHFKNLVELNILIAYCIEPIHLDLNFDEEFIMLSTESINLKTLRIDSMYMHPQHKFIKKMSPELRFIPELPEKVSKNLFANLTELYIHTRNNNQDPSLHAYSGKLALQCIIPSHPLEHMDITNEFFNITLPKCNTIALSGDFIGIADKIPNFSQVQSLKLCYLVDRPDRYISRFHRYLNLKSLTLFKVNVKYGEHLTMSKIKFATFIEDLTIKNSLLHHNFLQQLVVSTSSLKSLVLEQIDTYKDATIIEIDSSNTTFSNINSLRVIECCGTYVEVLEFILKDNPKFINHLHLISCDDSLGSEFLETLFSIDSRPENVVVEGIEFNDALIEKYLSWRSFPSTIDFSFQGRSITSKFLLNPKNSDTIHKISTLSLPYCPIDNEDFCEILDYLNRDRVEKIEINLGKSGPTVETFQELSSFKSLQILDIRGMVENMDISAQSLLNDSIREFVSEMPNLRECNLDSWNMTPAAIDSIKYQIRSRGRSAPKLNNNLDIPKPSQCLIS